MKVKKTEEGLTVKKEDKFSEWYQQLILKSDLADYTKVSGCIVFKPKSYYIWERIQSEVDKEFKKINIKNCYFPLFIPQSLFYKEEEHVEGFSPEVAWVTSAGNKELNEKLAVRPTSEAIMYDSYKKWIRSWRDLPLRLNQWNNVIRWEFKHPVPFLRTREFLWNEGHHVYSNREDLEKDKKSITHIYDKIMKNYMALPSLFGRKTNKEKFAGALESYSFELLLPNGKAIQGPDYHDDGQNFAKAYGIKFLDKNEKEQYCYQSTYAISTRILGVMFAIHSDNKGLIIPPKLAEKKIVIIPILFDKTKKEVLKKAEEINKNLSKLNCFIDDRSELTPGRKYNEWEMRGIPLQIEIGPRDIEKNQVIVKKRTGDKKEIKIKNLKDEIPKLLEEISSELYKKAENLLNNSIVKCENIEQVKRGIKDRRIAFAPLCRNASCENKIKDRIEGAKTLNVPEKQPNIKGKKCIICGNPADYYVYIGKSY